MQELIIEAGRAERHYWRDLWRYRELFFFLAWRDILVRYKQTAIGIGWALIRPLLMMIVFTVIFSKVAHLPTQGDVPYPLIVFAGLLPWQFFATALTDSSSSLIVNTNLISKIYFPRLIIPASSVITAFVDFLITFVLLGLMLVWYRFVPDWHLLALPVFVVMAFASAIGAGLLLSSLNVKYRDFRYIVPFIVQFGLYLSPVGFLTSVVPEKWRTLYYLNPMVGVIDGFRWSLLGGKTPLRLTGMLISLAVIALLLLVGVRYFRRTEKSFADVI